MRPLYLFIKGFGPYVKVEIKEEIFKILNEGRLFLITGEIGAGKTTLLDAILFALFGESSLSDRKPSDLISHFIKNQPNLISEVQFKFFMNGKNYFIVRRPPLANLSESVSLWIDDKLFSTKKTEIAEKIKELIGLGPKQFKKVFLIPQGEYRNILLSPPKERRELLQLIFETHFFSLLEEFLKEKTKELEKTLQNLENQEKIYYNLAQISNLLELKNKLYKKEGKLEELKNKINYLNLEKSKIDTKIKEKEELIQIFENLQKISEEIKKISSFWEIIKEKENILNKYKTLQNFLVYYENSKKLKKIIKNNNKDKLSFQKTLKLIKQKKKIVEQKLYTLKENEPEIEAKKREKNKIEELANFLEKQKEKKESLKRIYENLKFKEILLNQVKKELETYQNELEKTNSEKNKLKDFLLFKNEWKEKTKLKNKLDRWKYLKLQSKKLKLILEHLREQIEKLEKKKTELKLSYYAEELSKLLKPKTPCPVCGSTIHPNPKKPELLQESYLTLEVQEKKLKEELETISKQFYGIEGEAKVLEKELKEIKEEDLIKKLEELENLLMLEGFKEIEEKLKRNSRWVEELEKKLDFLSQKFVQTKKEEENLKKEVENLKGEYLSLEGSLKEIEEILKIHKIPENWEFLLKELEDEIKTWENQKISLEKELENLSHEEVKVSVSIENLREKINSDLKELKENLFALLELIKNQRFINFREIKTFFLNFSEKESLEKEIKTFYESWEYWKKNYESEEKKLKNLGYIWDEKTLISIKEEVEFLKNQKIKMENELKNFYEQKGSLEEEILKLREIKEKCEKTEKEKKDLEESYSILKNLTQLIEGKNKKGISFHSYVLSIFIKFILNHANRYLKNFSLGRYRFVEEEILGKNMVLEIFDYYTGSKREVKTLSGGESFIATLALALGTSDILIRISQAKPLETLLIDEGFGSLDETTLEKVIEALLNLANYSGRIIGIVSHLRELKEKFPIVLEVKKSPFAGSTIKFLKKF